MKRVAAGKKPVPEVSLTLGVVEAREELFDDTSRLDGGINYDRALDIVAS